MKRTMRRLAAVLLILAAASALAFALYHWDNKYTRPGSQPIAGMLFVDEGDWQQTPLRFLWNGWQFYPDSLLTPETRADLDTTRFAALQIGEYKNFSFANRTGRPHGCGTYLLTLQLPDTPHTYAIELPEIFSAYRFYVDDALLLEMGDPDPGSYRAEAQNRIVTFTASGATRLMLAVRDESHFYSGLIYPPAFGEPREVMNLQSWRLFLCAVTTAVTLLFAALALWVFLRTRSKRRHTGLFFLLCLCIAATISYDAAHSLFPMGVQPWYAIELTAGYLATLLIILLHNSLCGVSPVLKKVSGGIAGAFCLMMLLYGMLAAWLTQPVVDAFTALIPLFKVCTAVYLLATAVLALYHRQEQIGLLFYADIFYGAMLLWDRLLPAYEPVLGGWFREWGHLGLAAALGIVLSRDVVAGYRLSLTFREEQRQMERQIEIQQAHYSQLSQQMEESRRMRHDFRQHLRAIAGLASDEAALTDYVGKISVGIEAAKPERYCSNLAVDALLYHYVSAARKEGFPITIRIEEPPGASFPDEVVFCTMLGNLMENALEACQRQVSGKRFIRLLVRWQNDNLLLLLENSFDGIIQAGRSGYLSRKREGEGLGIVSVREVAQKLGGSVEFLVEDRTFRAMLSLPCGRKGQDKASRERADGSREGWEGTDEVACSSD